MTSGTAGADARHFLLRAVADPAHLGAYATHSLDWHAVLDLAEAQSIFPLLAGALSAAAELLDEPTRAAIGKRFDLHVRRSLLMTAELGRLLRLLKSQNIDAIPYKGPALAQMLYGDVAAREYSDLDLLVRRAQVAAAAAVLREAGYTPLYPLDSVTQELFLQTNYELAFSSPSGILVELHWDVAARHFSMALSPDELWADLRTVSFAGIEAPALSPENLLLLLSVHGAHHLWKKLAWLADVRRLLVVTPGLDFSRVIRTARRAHVERIVLLALELAHSVLGAALPPEIERGIKHDPAVAQLTNEVREKLLFHEGFSDLEFHGFLLRVRERRRDRARYAWRFLTTPTMQEWKRVRLPRPLHFLYPGIRLLRGVAKAARLLIRS